MSTLKAAFRKVSEERKLNMTELAILLKTQVPKLKKAMDGLAPLPKSSEIIACQTLRISPYLFMGMEDPAGANAIEVDPSYKANTLAMITSLKTSISELGGLVTLHYNEHMPIAELLDIASHLSERLSKIIIKNKERLNPKAEEPKETVAYLYEVRSLKGDVRRFSALSYEPRFGDRVVKKQGLVLAAVKPTVEFI